MRKYLIIERKGILVAPTPGALLPLFPVCMIICALLSFVAMLIIVIASEFVAGGGDDRWRMIDALAEHVTFAIFSCGLIWYLACSIYSLKKVAEAGVGQGKFITVFEYIIVYIISFAAIHFYIELWNAGTDYSNIDVSLLKFDPFSGLIGESARNFLAIPDLKTCVDFLYFSAVTFSTVGYGEIHPVSVAARLATIIQIVVGFSLVILVLTRAVAADSRS